jgi:tripartite ATP-independent transporter DctM subunit
MFAALAGIFFVLAVAFLGIPLAWATLFVGFTGFAILRGFDAAVSMSGQWIFDMTTNYGLSVIPLFVLMGSLMNRANISNELYEASYAWLGRFKGGLAMASVLACAGFSAVCGSSLATAATMSRVAMPQMRRFNYDDGLSAGTLAAGGTLGIMIPPSVPMVIYGIIASEDIGKLFIAGIGPGLLLVTLFVVAISLTVRFSPSLGPAGEAMPLGTMIRASYKTWPIIALFLIVLGGIYLGIFTPTESAAVGVIGTFLFGAARGRLLSRADLVPVFVETIRTTAMIFSIIFAALILAQFVNLTGMPRQLVGFVDALGLGPIELIVTICAICIVLGMIFESIGILVLIIPVFLPSLRALHVDLIWFGVIVILVIETGLITPPIGMNVFTVKAVIKDVPLGRIFVGVTPYVAAMIVALALIIAFPAIAVLLPRLMW